MGEALRRQGLDEHAVAGNWVHVVNRLTGNEPGDGGVEKLLVDVLKECSRQLDAEAAQASERSADAPVIVQLVHKVDRPMRPAPEPAPQANLSNVSP
ncbi:MAG: hypothetical protein ABR973_05025 [Candidatus Acidiferrales bacterium]|jgi:hypothetical protein